MKILIIGQHKFGSEITKIFSSTFPEVRAIQQIALLKRELQKRSWDLVFVDDDFFKSGAAKIKPVFELIRKFKTPAILFSSNRHFSRILYAKNLGFSDYVLKPYNEREMRMRVNAVFQKKTRITCIGGGSGLFNLLIGLKSLPQTLLTSVVSMSDDGGSSGKLSQSLGLLPPGDIRRSLVALSNAPDIMNQIMQYRFVQKGELEGHSFGNIFLAALTGVKGTMSEAVRSLGDILYLQGIVLPASKTLTKLIARFDDGTLVKGESKIDRCEGRSADLRITQFYHEPVAEADADAVSAILFSDFVTIGPGDLFTSVVTNLVIEHILEAVTQTVAKKIYICNLMTKPGETGGMNAADHVKEIVKYLKGDFLDYVIVSNTSLLRKAISDYSKKDQIPVNLKNKKELQAVTKAKIILADVGSTRDLVRHDSVHLKNEIQEIISAV